MKIQKIPKKFLIPVIILIVLLLAVVIYLSTKDSDNEQGKNTTDKKGKMIKIEDVKFNMPVYSAESCNQYINTYSKQTNDPKAEEKLNEVIKNTKKYTSFAYRMQLTFGSMVIERYINDPTHAQIYFGGREDYSNMAIVIDKESWSKTGGNQQWKKTETAENFAQEMEKDMIGNTLEEAVTLNNRAVTFDEKSKDTTLFVTGIRSNKIGDTTADKYIYLIVEFKDNILTSIQEYDRLTQEGENSQYCNTTVTAYSNVGDTFIIEKPE